jgi:hypothetical protein
MAITWLEKSDFAFKMPPANLVSMARVSPASRIFGSREP